MRVIYRPDEPHRCWSKDENDSINALTEDSPVGAVLICEECGAARVVAMSVFGKYLRSMEHWPFDRKQRAEVRAYRKANNL